MKNPLLASRREAEKQKIKDSIIIASIKIIEKSGVKALSIRAICTKIQYSLPVFYCYFKSKDEILKQISNEYLEMFYCSCKNGTVTLDELIDYIINYPKKWEVIAYFPENLIKILQTIKQNTQKN